ncbi:efflux transporter outer membrane subunit [Undibacterium sp. Rencai35W]|uniref:efflux transporter outer membrane subunit n=1 Tax=Undibacterium sp. Rencai35W TaxID=3413046 RepID=UPI003BF191D5
MILFLSGCAPMVVNKTGNDASLIPAQWSVQAPNGENTALLPVSTNVSPYGGGLLKWWQRFNDPILSSVVEQSLKSNLTIIGAQASLRQARALRDQAEAGLLPLVSSSVSAQHNTLGRHTSTNTYSAGFDASWELDIFGGNRQALNASEAVVAASIANLGDIQTSVTAEVAIDYIILRSVQARLLIARENLKSQEATQQLTQWRLQAGLVTELEVQQAIAAVEQTRAQIPVLQTSLDQTRHAISVLSGQAPSALSEVLSTAVIVPQAGSDLALDVPAETLRQRPDIRAAEYQVSAAMSRVAQADAARFPNFRIGGSLGLSAARLSALGDSGSLVSALLAGVTLPIFNGGALRAQVRVQQALFDLSTATYRATVLAALAGVEDVLVALRDDRDRLISLRRAADAAENAAGLARQRFSSGLIDFQVVLDTQRTQLLTQDAVAIAYANISTDQIRLYKALGGGWSSGLSGLPGLTSAKEAVESDQQLPIDVNLPSHHL